MTPGRVIRIGGASGFWGDSAIALPQLLREPALDFIVFDYLAEITMSILARARAANPSLGYAPDFVRLVSGHLPEIAERGLRLVANAGGVNPHACAALMEQRIAEAGLALKVGVVAGDDLLDQVDGMRGEREMFSGAEMPERLLSVNAYIGAAPIAAALDHGADIVITGRCVDSALVLGPCIHAFGWSLADYDRLSGGSLAGHIIECGAQASGGLFTDWETTGDWADIGYPIAEIEPDGTFSISKVAGTGGLVSRGTVSEQLVYEIGDPRAYILPDVVCDWAGVVIEEVASDRVRVSGARGFPAPERLKVSATWQDGHRVSALWSVIGIAAARKAEKIAEAVLRRVSKMLDEGGLEPFTETSVEVLGAEAAYGPRSAAREAREVLLKIAAKHPEPRALETLVREFTSAGTSMAPGFTGVGGNRPRVAPVIRLFSFTLPRSMPRVSVVVAGTSVPVAVGPPVAPSSRQSTSAVADWSGEPGTTVVPLIQIAWGRSGDKGNLANIGIIARRPEYLPYIRSSLDVEVVRACFAHYSPSKVERFDLPGIHAINFVLHDILGGGGMASLRNDPQGKGYAQMLMDVLIAVPASIATLAAGSDSPDEAAGGHLLDASKDGR